MNYNKFRKVESGCNLKRPLIGYSHNVFRNGRSLYNKRDPFCKILTNTLNIAVNERLLVPLPPRHSEYDVTASTVIQPQEKGGLDLVVPPMEKLNLSPKRARVPLKTQAFKYFDVKSQERKSSSSGSSKGQTSPVQDSVSKRTIPKSKISSVERRGTECLCNRPRKLIWCRMCGFHAKGYLPVICPKHPNTRFLNEWSVCGNPSCRAPNLLKEYDVDVFRN